MSSSLTSAYDEIIIETNASYLPSSDTYNDHRSIYSTHTDPSTRPTTYNQLIDYLKMLSVQVIEDPEDCLRMGKRIGMGATFEVQAGKLVNRGLQASVIAVKTPRESIHRDVYILSSIVKEVLDEIRVMSHFSLHPNIATILGVALEKSDAFRLLPRLLVERAIGSLGSLLRNLSLPWNLKMKFCAEIAAGVEALHLVEVVHGDVKADNILIFYTTSHWEHYGPPVITAKVADFGFCVPDTSSRDSSVAARGTVGYKAPEALSTAPQSLRQYANMPQRDLYSFGVLVWEVVNDGHFPFYDIAETDIPKIQLHSNDKAADHLISSSDLLSSLDSRLADFVARVQTTPLELRHNTIENKDREMGFLAIIRGTVRLQPTGDQGRIPWQTIFDYLTASSDESCTIYFSKPNKRQREVSWTSFQGQGAWLPTIPFPSTTWNPTDTHSELIMKELEDSVKQKPLNWIATIRLALHHFQVKQYIKMRTLLKIFTENNLTDLGEEGAALLHLSVREDAVEVIQALLCKSVDVNALDNSFMAPLHRVRSSAAARELIQHHANVHIRQYGSSERQYTPLHSAASGDIAELLIQSGADVHVKGYLNETPLHTASSGDIVRILVRHGADPLAQNSPGKTPLHNALSDDVALSLMSLCPESVRATDKLGRTPLHYRLKDWAGDTVRRAISYGADVNALDRAGQSPLFRDRDSPGPLSNLSAIRAIIEAGAFIPQPNPEGHSSPLHFTFTSDVMEFMLHNGFQKFINHRDLLSRGNTPLHYAADRDGALEKSWSSRNDRVPWVEKWGTPIVEKGTSHLLSRSTFVPSLELMKVLLINGADPNAQNKNLETPLHLVARNMVGHDGHKENLELLHILLESGADLNIRNDNKEAPLLCATRAETALELAKMGANVTLDDSNGATALHKAFRFTGYCHQVVSALVDIGGDINAVDAAGCTALHYACRSYTSFDKESKQGLDEMRHWAQRFKPYTHEREVSLMIESAYETTVEVLTALLDHGADVNVRTLHGKTALDLLIGRPFAREPFKLLRSRGAVVSDNVTLPWWALD